MRDLKNVIFFDDLLQESYNALVRQAKEEGKYALCLLYTSSSDG